MKRLLLYISVIGFFSACDDSEIYREVETIRYGTSFGMCAGYCLTDMEVTRTEAVVVQYGWNNSVPTKSATGTLPEGKFDSILNKVDVEKFMALEPVIGCPDCADGGAEWIEIRVDDRVKKVTFQYGDSVDGIETAIGMLREIATATKPD